MHFAVICDRSAAILNNCFLPSSASPPFHRVFHPQHRRPNHNLWASSNLHSTQPFCLLFSTCARIAGVRAYAQEEKESGRE